MVLLGREIESTKALEATVSTIESSIPRREAQRIARWRRVVGVTVLASAVAMVGLPAASSAAAAPTVAPANTGVPKRMMSGWLPYWTTAESVKSVVDNADLFSDVSPFWHNATKSGSSASGVALEDNTLNSGTRASNLAQLKGRGFDILPSITDGTGTGHMSSVMKNTAKRTALVNQIVNLVNSNGYDGIDLDFEKFAFSDAQSTWAATRPAWVAFVAELSGRLRANGKKLAVAVPPMGVTGSNYWVYDWEAIGPHIDKLRIMAYDYSWCTPGPIGGPLSWVEKVSAYAVSVLPPSKVQLGTPTYGRDWIKRSNCTLTGQKVYESRQLGTAIANTPASSWKRDPASQERYFNYSVTSNGSTVSRSAWLPDHVTVEARARIASKYGLNGLANWYLGGEQSAMWAPLRNVAMSLPFSAPTGPRSQQVAVKVTSKNGRKGRTVKVSGAVTPKRANAKVRLQVKQGGKWRTVKTVSTNSAGRYKIAFKHRTSKSSYRVKALKNARYKAKSSGAFIIRGR